MHTYVQKKYEKDLDYVVNRKLKKYVLTILIQIYRSLPETTRWLSCCIFHIEQFSAGVLVGQRHLYRFSS